MNRTRIIIVLILFFVRANIFSQTSTSSSVVRKQWSSSLLLSENVFIENKGQFNGKNNSGKNTIQYAVVKDGIEIYFGPNGLTYRYDELVDVTEKEERERKDEKKREEVDEDEKEFKTVSHFVYMNWLGSNADVEIVPEDATVQYYTYNDNRKSNTASIKALAYKKLIYKNLYPYIDVEYTFPIGKPGVKYALILHPGADPSVIKMKYKKQKNVKKDEKGNIIIESDFGDFVDHAPLSYDEQGEKINSAFESDGDIVSFKVDESYNKNQELIIDPYTTNPNITGYNAAYDVDYDTQGNVYVYGGRSSSIFQVKKFDSTLTVLKWVYSAGFNNNTPPVNRYYGDFAVDPVSQSVYIVEAENVSGTGARVVKLNASGNRIGTYPGDPLLTEMWRISFNSCTKKAIIGGGGAQATYQVCVLDTNVTTMTPVNVLNSTEPQHDLCLIALDNNNNCYMSFARSGPYAANFNNCIMKAPANTLTPSTTLVAKDNHDFAEAFNIVYVNNDPGAANGFNGMAVSNNWLYTYDGQLIQRWNKNTGVLMKSATLSATPFTWGGIAVDECENVYVGVKNTVIKYDLNFNVIATVATTTDNVYDVKLGNKNKLYVCGKGFVSVSDLVIPICNPLVITHSTTSICGAFTASVTVSGGNPPYSYTWNPGGATTSSITGITPGIYTVTVTDGAFCIAPQLIVDTIKVILGPGILSSTGSVDAVCGILGSANVTASNGTPGYTYQWSNGGTDANITGLIPGTYSVTVTDSKGCTKIDSAIVNSSGSVIANVGPASSICVGAGIPQILTVTSIGGINYIWSTGETTTSISVLPSVTTTYTVIASTNQCADTVDVTVTVNPLPIANLSGTNVCFTNSNAFTNLSVGNNTFTQLWDFGDGNTSTALNPVHIYGGSGTYTVSLIITNNFGCKDTNSTTVVVNPMPKVNFSSVPVCLHDSTCFKDLSSITTGSITGWSWNFDDPSSGANNISNLKNPCHKFSGLGPFNVILTITSDSGCQSITNHPATINPPPDALFINSSVCLNVPTGFTSTSTSSGTDPINVWNWDFGDGTKSGLPNPSHIYPAGSYTVTLIVTTAGGCKDTITKPVTVHQLPVANFVGKASGCMPVCVSNYADSSTCSDLTIATWKWSFPGGSPSSSSQQKPPTICYSSPGSYGASLTVMSNYGCKDSIAITPLVNVYSLPQAEFCVAPAIAPATDPVFNFCDMWSKDVAQWSWDFGDGSAPDSVDANPIHSYSATANENDFYKYNICINVETQYGCKDHICHSVELIPEFEFYIPNTFTPNGDGNNEMFFGKCRGVKEYDIWVFDRWGNQIWDCHKEDKNTNWDSDATSPRQEGLSSACQWDGIVVQGGVDMNGNSRQFAQEDVYVWKVHLTDVFNKRHTYIGQVNVVR